MSSLFLSCSLSWYSFNRAINSNRQIGSTIKPFIYSVGLDQTGVRPSDIFMDSDLTFDIGNGITWNPRNHDRKNKGPLTVRSGIEKSRNAITIRLMEKIGINRVVSFLKKLKLSDKKIESNYSIGIGAVEGSPLSVARAYSIFINDGKIQNLKLISSIKDKNNKELLSEPIILDKETFIPKKENLQAFAEEESEKEPEGSKSESEKEIITPSETDKSLTTTEGQVEKNEQNTNQNNTEEIKKDTPKEEQIISPQTSYQMYSILEGAVKRGSGFGLLELKIPVGAKTGTSDKGRDLWTASISENLCVVIYTGYDTPKETDMFGLQGAFPVVKNILKEVKSFYPISAKNPPEGLKFIKINLKNGKRTTQPLSKNVIYEVFKNTDETDDIPEEKKEDEEHDTVLDDF
jgi:penicillin-binding protein 1A